MKPVPLLKMLLEAKRARHGMHVVVSVGLAESTSNKKMYFSETTVLNDTPVHMQHNRTPYAPSTRLARTHARLTLTLTITYAISQRCADCPMRIWARTAIAARAVAAVAHQKGRKRRPTTGCCMRPHRPFCTIHHLRASDRRCRWPLVLPRGRPTFGTSRKCSARMGTRGTRAIDRRYTQVSIRGGREQGRQGRERSTRWYRGGGEAWCTPKKSPLSMNWAACKRSEGARSNASRMPKKPMTGSRPEHNWRRRAGCTHGGLSGAISVRFLHAAWSKASGGYAALNSHAREGRVCVRHGNKAPRSLQRRRRRTHDMVAREGGSLRRT